MAPRYEANSQEPVAARESRASLMNLKFESGTSAAVNGCSFSFMSETMDRNSWRLEAPVSWSTDRRLFCKYR